MYLKSQLSLVNKTGGSITFQNVVAEDVRDISKAVGVKFKCDTSNSFNLLTKKGRREWRAAGGDNDVNEVVGGSGSGGGGC